MTREEALDQAMMIITYGAVVTRNMKQKLQDAIGELTDEERELLDSCAAAREARDVESDRQITLFRDALS